MMLVISMSIRRLLEACTRHSSERILLLCGYGHWRPVCNRADAMAVARRFAILGAMR
jgi:hypothetical protein